MTYPNHSISRRSLRLAYVVAFVLFAALTATSFASAAALKVTTVKPDHVTAGKGFFVILNVQNMGDQPLAGPLTINTTFPSGVVPAPWLLNDEEPLQCQAAGQQTECTIDVTGLLPGVQLHLRNNAEVEPAVAGPLTGGQVEVSGGGVPGSFTEPLDFDTGPIGPFAISSFDVIPSASPILSGAQAGADPTELLTRFSLLSEARSTADVQIPNFFVIAPTAHLRDVVVHVPPGLIGYPTSTPIRCTLAQLTTPAEFNGVRIADPDCPPESQVGLAQVNVGDIAGIFNLVPPPGSPAAFGFFYNGIVVTLLARVRPSDNGINIVTEQVASSIPLPRTEVTLWGVPSAKAHDPLRGICLHQGHGYNPEIGDCSLKTRNNAAFLRNPTSCPGTDLPWGIEADTYQHPGTFVNRETTSPATEGCAAVPFEPEISLAPDSSATHSPSGLDVDLSLPQDAGPSGIATADLRRAIVVLPEGVAINPASADGLAACTDAQLRLGLEGPSDCPDAAKLGSVEITTPLLDQSLGGSVFLRSQASGDPESGDLYRLAIELRSDRDGVAIKLPGSLVVNKDTGRLTATFDELPQLPFESMRLHFKSGPRAPLSTPSTCGAYSSRATLTSWSGKTVQLDSPFTVDQNCAAGLFAPGFQAGVANSTAGEFSPFLLRVTREDGQPNISRIDTTLPEGELAKLAGVGVCPDAGAASGICPASSLLGSTTVGVGNGTSPLYLPQPGKSSPAVYLAGPYKGAPYSIVVTVPAQAGPFDLGIVAVRSALRVDPTTTQASVLSDPLPQIVGGVPVAYRDVRFNVDRPGFSINPTSCKPKSVSSAIASVGGAVANVSDRFQVHDCAALAFKPKLALALKGGTARGKHPALRATLTMPRGGANIAGAAVTLPHSEFLAQDHIRTVCTRVQFAAGGGGGEQCPPGSVYGRATVTSPLLDRPLSGPVYLRSSSNPLPDLVAALDGDIHVDLLGRIDSKNGGIRATFAALPDAPATKVVLSMQGGRKGLLENSTNLCKSTNRATAKFDAQNGKIHDIAPVLKANCGKKGKRK